MVLLSFIQHTKARFKHFITAIKNTSVLTMDTTATNKAKTNDCELKQDK